MSPPVDVSRVLGQLRDFQVRTARYAFSRLYDEEDPALRFLVADEVGLGKTFVARGVVALAIDHLHRLGDKRHDIVYVCSNGAIARQNLNRLNPTEQRIDEPADRFSMLPLSSHRRAGRAVNLVAVTPSTSLRYGSHAGRFPERALAFTMLRHHWDRAALSTSRARWLFWFDVEWGERRLLDSAKWNDQRLAPEAIEAFGRHLDRVDADRARNQLPSLRDQFDELTDGLRYKRSFPDELRKHRGQFIAALREVLAAVGVDSLEPDLVILDEFQRFKDLLSPQTDSWASQLAHRLFTHVNKEGRPTRTLLLSATPYRMYTDDGDADGDRHHVDFVETTRFLLEDESQLSELTSSLRDLRTTLLRPSDERLDRARTAAATTGRLLRRVMVRTERLASTEDRDGMLVPIPPDDITVEPHDIETYLAVGRVAEALEHPDLLELWKSSPYLLNLMEEYDLKRRFNAAAAGGVHHAVLARALQGNEALLPWGEVDAYQAIDSGNARLRSLLNGLDQHGAWNLAWLPPSQRYYEGRGAYDAPAARAFTKRLVFSGWKVVPKAIAVLTSYESERRLQGGGTVTYSTPYQQRTSRRLDFRTTGRKADRMTTFLLLWPSPSLAELGDPRAFASAAGGLPEVAPVIRSVARRIDSALRPIVATAEPSSRVDERWYWAAPLLLDAAGHGHAVDTWFGHSAADEAWGVDAEDRGFSAHTKVAWQVFTGRLDEPLGSVPADLADVLARVALGGPAVCALRSLHAITGLSTTDAACLAGAARVAVGFRSLFNTPDITALVDASASTKERGYWRRVVDQCVDGNLQAVLDEYAHVLVEWLGHGTTADQAKVAGAVADQIRASVTAVAPSYRVDLPSARQHRVAVDEARMRARFAAQFGDQRNEDGRHTRAEQLTASFNSPFWPFVLATTSIGQEGLDFHLYCHAVVHWNLPHNPVDLEQREGRVHRYKGHAVRKNVAAAHGQAALGDTGDPWSRMFDLAAGDRRPGDGDLVPYWVYPMIGGASIERHTSVLPFSREAARLPALLRSVSLYRLALGQPRQSDLLAALADQDPEELRALVEAARVDLGPPQA